MRVLQILVLLLLPIVGFSQAWGKVVSVADGDTFTMVVGKKKIKVRLYGVDCPEKGQPYGEEAKKYLIRLIKLHQDSIQVFEKGKDRYKRTVGIVYTGTTNLNESLLEQGLAWHYNQYDKNVKWTTLEVSARKAKVHLWSEKNPTPPWEWRKKGNRIALTLTQRVNHFSCELQHAILMFQASKIMLRLEPRGVCGYIRRNNKYNYYS